MGEGGRAIGRRAAFLVCPSFELRITATVIVRRTPTGSGPIVASSIALRRPETYGPMATGHGPVIALRPPMAAGEAAG